MQQILDVLNIVYVTLTGNIFHFTSKKKLYSLQLFPQNLLLCLLMKKQKGKANISTAQIICKKNKKNINSL